jgi:hypothetical protein
VSEVGRIRTHLFYVIERLENADTAELSESQRRRRARALDGLRDYAKAGVFPRRDRGDGYDVRRPRFIDDRGVHCAVGEMIRRSGHSELARAIRDRWEFAYVPDIDSPALVTWTASHGFNLTELAQIQPTYRKPSIGDLVAQIERGKDTWTLQCAREHNPPESVELRFRGDDLGRVSVSVEDDSDGFSRCFRNKIETTDFVNGIAIGHTPLINVSGALDRTLNIGIFPPSELVKSRLEKRLLLASDSTCLPRPGAIPKAANVHLVTGFDETSTEVRAEPRNKEVDQCLTRFLEQVLPELEGGGRWDLDLKVRKPLAPSVTDKELKMWVRSNVFTADGSGQVSPVFSAARACKNQGEDKTYRVHVEAQPKSQRFEVDVDGDYAEFQECFVKAFNESAKSVLSVPRQLPDGEVERYFRIDAVAQASYEVSVSDADPTRCPVGVFCPSVLVSVTSIP